MSSRVYKIGTIYSRVEGMLRKKGLPPEEKPLWFDVYAHFPPMFEPKFDRKAPDTEIKEILYEEDTLRSKIYKRFSNTVGYVDLTNDKESRSQKLLKTCQKYIADGMTENDALNLIADELEKNSRGPEKIFADKIEKFRKSFPDEEFKKEPEETKKITVDIKELFEK